MYVLQCGSYFCLLMLADIKRFDFLEVNKGQTGFYCFKIIHIWHTHF